MQVYQRRAILSAALDLPPGKEITRDTVKAALWAAFGFSDESESRVSRLLAVIDAYTDVRSRRAIHIWANSGNSLPPISVDLAQHAAVRRMLTTFSASTGGPTQLRNTVTPPRALSVVPLPAEDERILAGLSEPLTPVPLQHTRLTPALSPDNELAKYARLVNVPVQAAASDADVVVDHRNDDDDDDDDDDALRYECNTCHVPKKQECFYRSKVVKRGFERMCKDCKNQKSKEYRSNKKKRELEEAVEAAMKAVGFIEDTDGTGGVTGDQGNSPEVEAEAS